QGNVAGFVASCREDLLKVLRAYVRSFPTTDEGWGKLVRIKTGLGRADVTEEQREAIHEEERRLHRQGVEVLRAYFAASREGQRPCPRSNGSRPRSRTGCWSFCEPRDRRASGSLSCSPWRAAVESATC